MSFIYSDTTRCAIDSANGLMMERRTVTKEQVHIFCLNWQERQIVVSARADETQDQNGMSDNWIIDRLGGRDIGVEPYEFANRDELEIVVQIAKEALQVTPYTPGSGRRINVAISARLSGFIERYQIETQKNSS